MVWAPPPDPAAMGPTPRGSFAHTIYLQMSGGTYQQGSDNPGGNSSFLVRTSGPATVAAFQPAEPEKVARMLRCVRLMFGRFNVEVTDQEPPSGTAYVEAVVTGGSSNEIGLENSILGIAPGTCDVREPSIVWIFGAFYDNDVQSTCETAAQEIAHAYGLDHETICEDPMTYESGCQPKTFQDRDAPCGEFSGQGRECFCGGTLTQNSVALLKERLGEGEVIPPTVAITGPAEGASLTGTFHVTADAQDNYIVATTELWIDGELFVADELPPFDMIAPRTLEPGPHALEVRAYDANNNRGIATVNVTTVAECATDDECSGEGQRCNGWYCAGELGATCVSHDDCVDGTLCGAEGTENRCTMSCTSSSNTCPGGFECLAGVGGTGKCWPSEGGGCGCVVSGHARLGLGAGVLLFAAGLVLIRRRRRAA